MFGAEDIVSSEPDRTPSRQEASSPSSTSGSSSPESLFCFVPSPSLTEDVVELEASRNIEDLEEQPPIPTSYPLEPDVVVEEVGSCSPGRVGRDRQLPVDVPSGAQEPAPDSSVPGLSDAPVPSPAWPSAQPSSSVLDDKMDRILNAISAMEKRISSLETNQFPGFEPSDMPPKSILRKGTSSTPAVTVPQTPPAASQASVEFSSPVVQPAPENRIPVGWQKFRDGMSLGQDMGSLVFADGSLLGPQSVEIDLESYEVPVWRMRQREGSARPLKGKIPVRAAYDNFQALLEAAPISALEWRDSAFKPPGSKSDRALKIALDDDAVVAEFFNSLPGWFKDLNRREKIMWEEAASPANFVPDGLSAITAAEFVKTFEKKEFSKNELAKLLNIEKLPSLPKSLLRDEYGARQSFLSSLNVTLAAEAMARQCPPDNLMSPGLFSLLKLTLQPLWSAFLIFAKKKLQLRRSALRACWNDHSLVIKLMASNPLTEDLFDREAVQDVITQAERQAKPVMMLLGKKFQGTKRSAPPGTPRTPKKPRLQQGSSQEQGGYRRDFQSRREDRSFQDRRKDRQSSPSKRGLRTPRKGNKSPGGRGQRGQGTPNRNPPGNQGGSSNF